MTFVRRHTTAVRAARKASSLWCALFSGMGYRGQGTPEAQQPTSLDSATILNAIVKPLEVGDTGG
jgi:hypothetical protein